MVLKFGSKPFHDWVSAGNAMPKRLDAPPKQDANKFSSSSPTRSKQLSLDENIKIG